MPPTILLKRGTTAKNLTYSGSPGEVTVDTDLKLLRVQDGTTLGGIPVAKAATTLLGYGITDAAPLISPGFTGVPTVPTAPLGTNNSQAASCSFVALALGAGLQGLQGKISCRVATTQPLTASSSGGILTNTGSFVALTVDSVALSLNDRVLVKNQTNGAHNGIYAVTNIGSGSTSWTLTRTADADTNAEMVAGVYTFVTEGTDNADNGFFLVTNNPIALDTTALVFTQFNGAGQITSGAGLTKNGNILDIGTASSSRIVVGADTIDLATVVTAGAYKIPTVDAYGRVTGGSNPTTLLGFGITDAAPLISAALTGIPTTPTAATGTNTTQIASTAFVQQELAVIDGGVM
jgi:hypothetical protein